MKIVRDTGKFGVSSKVLMIAVIVGATLFATG